MGSYYGRRSRAIGVENQVLARVVDEYLSALDTPDHDVVQGTGSVQAGLSRHGSI